MNAAANKTRHRHSTPMLKLIEFLARRAPGLLLACGALLGFMVYALRLKRRQVVEINLELVFPELALPERRALARRNLVSTGRGMAELLIAWRTPLERLPRAEIKGLQHLRAAQKSGRGVLLLTAHTHPIELGIRLLREALNEPVHALAREHNQLKLQAWIDAGRRAQMGPTYQKREVRAMLQALRKGALVAYAPDQNFNTQSEFLQFFNIPAATLVSWPRMLKAADALPLTLLTARTKDGYLLEIGEAFAGIPSADPAHDTQRYLSRVEAFVRRYPEQYLWAHRRFKKRPSAEVQLYPKVR